MRTSFPDKKYLKSLVRHEQKHALARLDDLEKFLVFSGISLNWIADFLTDETIKWEKIKVKIDTLILTGTNPRWNAIILDKCESSPQKFREFLRANKKDRKIFKEAKFVDFPILVRIESGQLKVLDGMRRVVAAIRDGRKEIWVWVAKLVKKPKPKCEPHVLYDFIRSRSRHINENEKDFTAALNFLRKSYSNVDKLLEGQFNQGWIEEKMLQLIRKQRGKI